MKVVDWSMEYSKYYNGEKVSCPACGSDKVEAKILYGPNKRQSIYFKCKECGSAVHYG